MPATCIHCLNASRHQWRQVIFTANCAGCEATALATLAMEQPTDVVTKQPLEGEL